jgi:hypothetical protein
VFRRLGSSYERQKRREDFVLEAGYVLILLAAVIGSAVFINWILPGHRQLSTGLSLAAWVGIFGVVDARSMNREIRHKQDVQDAYQRGRLEAQTDESVG